MENGTGDELGVNNVPTNDTTVVTPVISVRELLED